MSESFPPSNAVDGPTLDAAHRLSDTDSTSSYPSVESILAGPVVSIITEEPPEIVDDEDNEVSYIASDILDLSFPGVWKYDAYLVSQVKQQCDEDGNPLSDPYMYCDNVSIPDELSGKGLATKLVEALAYETIRLGINEIRVNTLNPGSLIIFLRIFGFKRMKFDDLYGDIPTNAEQLAERVETFWRQAPSYPPRSAYWLPPTEASISGDKMIKRLSDFGPEESTPIRIDLTGFDISSLGPINIVRAEEA